MLVGQAVGSHALAWLALLVLSLCVSNCSTMPQTPGAPYPHLGRITWRSYDGKEMPWRPSEVPKGHPVRAVVITVHGLSGAALDFWPLGEALPPKGIAVYGIELRGQGNDPDLKARGDIASAKVWQDDLITFHRLVRERHPGVPILWYSESLGTLIAMHALQELPAQERPVGLAMSSPAAGLRIQPGKAQYWLLRGLITLLPGKKFNLEKLAGVDDSKIRVTHDTTHEAQMAKTPHYVPEFSLRLLGQIDAMMKTLPAQARQTHLPVLVLASPNDVIASEDQIQAFYNDIASKDKTIHWYRKSYHLLLHDTQRKEVLQDDTEWIEKHVAQGPQ